MEFARTGVSLKGVLWLVIVLIGLVECRKHFLDLEDDPRRLIQMSTFGFFRNGLLEVHVHDLSIRSRNNLNPPSDKLGFTVDRTLSAGINPYSPNLDSGHCFLNEDSTTLPDRERFSRIVFFVDLAARKLRFKCDQGLQNVYVFHNTSNIGLEELYLERNLRKRRDVGEEYDVAEPKPPPSRDAVDDQQPAGSEIKEMVAEVKTEDKKLEDSRPLKPGVVDMLKRTGSGLPVADGGNPDPRMSSPRPEIDKVEITGDKTKEAQEGVPPPPENAKNPNGDASKSSQSDGDVALVARPIDRITKLKDGYQCNKDYEWDLKIRTENSKQIISFDFTVFLETPDVEGLYHLYFHNCLNGDTSIDLNMSLTEMNEGRNYLSAGDMPLPSLYFMMSIVFCITGVFWVYFLKRSKKQPQIPVFKIHYLMGLLVFLKSLSLLFHAINFHYIETMGTHLEGFAVIYYTVHLLKGAVLFITLLLIGTGYAFIKHLLSDKEKRIFMVVIPLQVLANVANIIMEESEEAESKYLRWKVIFYSLDLFCCGAILFPVIWSIRHLQEASGTDGKAATSLRKLKLFRHFYIIVVCYIYFTRIIVNLLLKITIQFQYEWLDEMFTELAAYVFYVLVGYKFRPAANNPYLELAHDSDEETDIALTESGLLEGVSKRGRPKKKTLKEIVYFDDSDDDEEVLLDNQGGINSNSRDFSMSMS